MIYGALGFSLLLSAIVFMFIMQNKKRYIHLAEKKEREYQYKNELLNTQIELQEHLLNQVSQEIHDNVGQVLSLVKVHLYSVSNKPGNEKATELLDTSTMLLDKAIEDLRNISHAKSSTVVQTLGLKEAIGKELEYIKALKQVACGIVVTGNQYSLEPEQELFIYRIVQEAVNNSIKHASGTTLTVELDYGPAVFLLKVTDNGMGFDPSAADTKSGIGISHMKHRAKLLKGAIRIESQPLNGTSVILTIPVG